MDLVLIVAAIVVMGLVLIVIANFTESNDLEEKRVDMPYSAKEYFFSRSELEFFRILNSHLDAHKYTLFPKVRLADFVKVDGGNKDNYASWNRIKSKHVDYLIWDLTESKVVLAVELDGNSHSKLAASKSDSFKNEMYEAIGLQLVRVRVGTSFEQESQKIAEMLQRF